MTVPGLKNAIQQAGYTSFYDEIWCSDHRGTFVDLSTRAIFDGDTPDLHTQQPRHVTSNNKNKVFSFITNASKTHRIITEQ
jgi:hypothetical protein